ncbi:unnamed protein product [Fraxinus pennsylvanica]|uniref:Protein kinase domain-containing protein n=1 Tax=Fraxinus pennsylvanica TaxID=56036 RepID=A0AAD2ABP5_9LAMI|nr:unnamed protein product [Fraxinus pennsylvanica]
MVNLYRLDLRNNQLSEQLPGCLGNISSLRNIHLDYNGLTSTIPSTLWSNKEIQILALSHNLLIGSLSQEIGSLKSLRELHLSGNKISGDIPTTIGQLQSLINLTLSNNRLHGPIPDSFGDLKELEYLDLSDNILSGLIPKSLESLEYLKYFNVSFNKLSGEIPNGGLFKNLTRDSFVGNGELCGASRFMVMACKSNTSKSSSKTRNLKYILPPCALVACIVIITVWFVRCNRNKPLPTQSSFPIALAVKRVSYYEVLSATNNFDEENLIGRGSIGSVYKGLFSDGIIAAIKVFNLDVEGAVKSFDTECSILCNIRHRNLVKVITCCSNLDLKALVLEYMPKGNLSIDFGISKLLKEDQRISVTKTLGTIGYMAPEYGSTGLISTMVDVYSYGIILMETFTKRKPTDAIFEGELTMRRWVIESFPDAIMQIVDIDVVNEVEENIRSKERCITSIMGLALECTSDLPEERLNMKDVLTRLKEIKTEFHPGITTRFAPEISSMKSFRALYLSGNQFSSDISSTIGYQQSCLIADSSNMKELQYLGLSNNNIYVLVWYTRASSPTWIVAAIKVSDLDMEGALDSFDAGCQIMCNIHYRNLVKIVDVDVLNQDEENVKAKESYFKSIMRLALECIADLAEKTFNMEHVVIRLKKIKSEVFSSISKTEQDKRSVWIH